MYWEKMKRGLCEVMASKDEGMDEVFALAERCREQLYEMLDEEGIVILEQYITCMDILNSRSDFTDKKTMG